MSKQTFHPFYCHKANCRKTAWSTPEYTTETDRVFIRKVIPLLKADDAEGLWRLFSSERTNSNNFFNHVIGWPEGGVYCLELPYLEKCGIHCLKKHELQELEKYLHEFDTLTLTGEG